MAKKYEGRVIAASSSQFIAAVTAVTLDSPAAAVHVNSGTTMTVRLQGDTADRTYAVVAGSKYEYRVVSVPATNSAELIALFN